MSFSTPTLAKLATCLLALATLPSCAQTTTPGTAPKPPATTTAPKPTPPKPAPSTTPSPITSSSTTPSPTPKPAAPKSPTPKKPATADIKSLPPGTLPPGPFNRTTIFLDPAHGGLDAGSRISDSVLEKDITLAFAFKLRSLLAARGFTVVMARDSDAPATPPSTPQTLDDRAGLANHAHPVACLLLHATAAGAGVHLYSSELDPISAEVFGAPWLTAQAAWVTQSQHLQKDLSLALTRANIPLVLSRASVRPVDSLTCPALVVELAPSTAGDSATLNDASYQQHIAEAIAAAIVFWQNQAQPPPRLAPTPPATPFDSLTPTVPPAGAPQ